MTINRGRFMKLSAASTVALTMGTLSLHAQTKNGIPCRKLGKTGLEVSLLAIGGY
jgi:hypothetical protein